MYIINRKASTQNYTCGTNNTKLKDFFNVADLLLRVARCKVGENTWLVIKAIFPYSVGIALLGYF